MSSESRHRLSEEAKCQKVRLAQWGKFLRVLPFAGVLLVAASTFAWIHFHAQQINATVAVESPSFKQPETFKELLALPPSELAHCDIARMNLLCAKGLPGAENLNVEESLATLDLWAQHIKSETDRNFHHYWEDPAYFYNSTNFYKMAMMAVVLYEDYNIRYNPKWIEPDWKGNQVLLARAQQMQNRMRTP